MVNIRSGPLQSEKKNGEDLLDEAESNLPSSVIIRLSRLPPGFDYSTRAFTTRMIILTHSY